MLFLDTCIVEASGTTVSKSGSITISTDIDGLMADGGTSFGTISNGTGVISGTSGYSLYYRDGFFHFKVPVVGTVQVSDVLNTSSVNLTSYYECYNKFVSFSCNFGTPSNVFLTDSSGTLISSLSDNYTYNPYEAGKGLSILHGTSASSANYFYYLEFDYSYTSVQKMLSGGTGAGSNIDNPSMTLTWSLSFEYYLNEISEEAYINRYVEASSDPLVYGETKEISETAQDTNETTHSIFDSISEFFGSFFDNLIGIFVPEDGYFSGWFDRVNTLLSEKLGMLYAPFDLVISTLQAIYSSSTSGSGIPFPGIKWEDTWLVEPFTFTFASLGSDFDDLRDKVYFATDTVLVFTFLMLLQSKVKLILEGHE